MLALKRLWKILVLIVQSGNPVLIEFLYIVLKPTPDNWLEFASSSADKTALTRAAAPREPPCSSSQRTCRRIGTDTIGILASQGYLRFAFCDAFCGLLIQY